MSNNSASTSSNSIHPQGVDELGSSGNSGALSSISSNSSDHAAFSDDEDNESNYTDTQNENSITSSNAKGVRFTGGTEFNDRKLSAHNNDKHNNNDNNATNTSTTRRKRPLPSSYNFTNDQMMARDDADGDNDDEDYFTANPLPLMSSNDALAMDALRATVARQQQDQARHGSFKSSFSEQEEAERDADGRHSESHSRSYSYSSASSSTSSSLSSPSHRGAPKVRVRRPTGGPSPHLSVLRGPILPVSSGRSAFENFDKDEDVASKTNNNTIVKKIATDYNSVPLVMPRPEYLKAVNNYREYSSGSGGNSDRESDSDDHDDDEVVSSNERNQKKKDRKKKETNKKHTRKSVETEHALTVLLRHNPSHCPPFAVYSNLPEVSQAAASMEKRLGPGYVSSYTFSPSSPTPPSAFFRNGSSPQPTASSRNSPTSPQVSSNRGTWVRNFFIDVCFTKQTTVYTTDNAETRARKLKNVWVENDKRWPGYDYSRCIADALIFRNRSGLPLKLNADGSSQSSTSYAAASPSASVGIRKGGGGKGVDGREPLSGSVITNSRDSVLPLIAVTYLYGMDEQVPLSMMRGAAAARAAPTSCASVETATDLGKTTAAAKNATEALTVLASERGRDVFTYINSGERRDAALVCDGPSRGIGMFPNNRMCTTHLHEALVGSAGESTMPAVSVGGRGGGATKSTSSSGKTKSRHFVALRYLPSLCRAEDLLASDAGGDLFFRSSPVTGETQQGKGRDSDPPLSPADQLEEARTFFGQFFRPQNETQLKKVLHPAAAKVLAAAPPSLTSSSAPSTDTPDGTDGVANDTSAGSPATSLPRTTAASGCVGNGATVQDPASHGVRSLASSHRLAGHPFYRMRQVLGYDVSCMLTSAVNLNSPDPTDDEELLLIECPSRSAKALLLARIQRALVSFYAGMRRVHAKNVEQNPNPFSSVSAVSSSVLSQKGGSSSRRRKGREGEGILHAPRLRGDEEDGSEGDERHAHNNGNSYNQQQVEEGVKHPLHADSRFTGAGYGVLDEDLCLDVCLQRTFHMHAMRRLFFQCANKNRAALVNAAGALSKGLGLSITPPHQQQQKQRLQRASNDLMAARPSVAQTTGPEGPRSDTAKASSSLPVNPSPRSPASSSNTTNTNTNTTSKRTAIIDSFDASADDEVTILHKLLKSPPLKDSGVEGIFNYLMLRARTFVSLKKRRFTAESFNLDLAYVRPDMIAMGYPSVGKEALYRNPLQETMRFLETYHNLSGASYPVTLTSLILGLEMVSGTSSIPVGCPFDISKETCPVLLSTTAAAPAVTRRISLFGGGKASNATSTTTTIYGYGAVCKLAKVTAALAGIDYERDTVRSCAFMLPYQYSLAANSKSSKSRQTQHVDGAAGIASSPTSPFSLGGITFFGQKDRKKWEEEQTERVLETYAAVERFLYHDALAVARSLCNNSVPSYRIYNLCSERCYPPSRFAGSFERFPADDHHPAPFNTLLAFCVSAGCFLAGGDSTLVPLFQLEKVLPPGMPSASGGHHHDNNMNSGTTSLATNKNEGGTAAATASGKMHKVSGAISSLLFSNRKHGQLQFMPVDPSLVDASALQRVVAVHCKAGKGRTGAMCVALMLYLGQFERGWSSIGGREGDAVAASSSSPSPPRASSVGASNSATSDNVSKLGRSSPLFDRRIHPLFRALNWYGITRTHNNKGVSIASQLQFLEYLNWYLESERHRLARLFGSSQHPEDVELVKQHPKLTCPVNFPIHYVPQLLRPPPCPTALLKSVSFSPYPCVDLDGKCKPYFIILCRGPNHTHYPLGQQEHVSVEADTLRPIYDSRLGWLSQKPHRRTELTTFGTSSSSTGSPHGSKTSVRVVEKSSVSAMPPEATLASYQRDAELAGGDVTKLMAMQTPNTSSSVAEQAYHTPLLPPGVDPETTAYFPMRGFEITGEVRFVFYAEQRTNSLLFGTSSSTPSSSQGGSSSPAGEGAAAAKSTSTSSSKKKSGKSKDQYLFSFWIHTGFMQQQSRATRIEAYTPEGKFTHTTTDNKKSAKDDAAAAASANSGSRTAAGRGGSISGGNNTQHQQLSRFSRFAHLADSVDCLDLHATARSGGGGVVRLRKEQLDGASKKNSKFFDSGFTCNIEFTLL